MDIVRRTCSRTPLSAGEFLRNGFESEVWEPIPSPVLKKASKIDLAFASLAQSWLTCSSGSTLLADPALAAIRRDTRSTIGRSLA